MRMGLSPSSNILLINIRSCDQLEAMVHAPGDCSGKHTSEGFDHLGAQDVPPLIYRPQEVLINPLPTANYKSADRRRSAVDVRCAIFS